MSGQEAIALRGVPVRLVIGDELRRSAEFVAIPLLALLGALALFGVFVACSRVNPLELYALMYKGAFGTWFSWQNTLVRAAPLILTALCTGRFRRSSAW
jgi:ABC-type uncharacterized transport system permease subunit